MNRHIFYFLIAALFISACRNTYDRAPGAKVFVSKQKEGFKLIRNNSQFHIRGAAGSSYLHVLRQTGGNTIRIWDTTNLGAVLDSAKANHLAVIVGFPILNSSYQSYYKDPLKVAGQHRAFKAIVKKFRKHDAVLMWCVGNELDFPFGFAHNNFYKAFNNLTDMIHADDPDHPVTTTVLNFNKKYVFNIQLRCNVDLISFNIFSLLKSFRRDLAQISWFWNGPYILAEWGIDGPWEGTPQTAWGAYIETTSRKKAEVYLNRFKQHMPVEDPRFLGCLVFYWGSKQETTHTWFSMFDRAGRRSEATGVMKYLWTGSRDTEAYPAIRYMLVNKKGAADNILLSPGSSNFAEVLMDGRKQETQTVAWQIFREDWYKKNNENNTAQQFPLTGLITQPEQMQTSFRAPSEEGPYRIFVTISDHKGHFSTCNTPFYVISDR